MAKFQNIAGIRFGKLVVQHRVLSENDNRVRWLCKCDCGKDVALNSINLTRGSAKCCGCTRQDHPRAARHPMAGTKIYAAWQQVLDRCTNPKNFSYENYGGRGIKVCERWYTFSNFFEDMGHPPQGGTLERKENDGPYSPDNCKWAHWTEQHNNKRSNRKITAFGRTQNLQEWATEYGLPLSTLKNRLDRAKMEPEDALTVETKRRNVTAFGKTQNLAAWAQEFGLPDYLIFNRLKSGWPVEAALTEPLRQGQKYPT